MDRDELLERLRGVEWDDFEVKRSARAVPDDAYRTVSAFANTSGGWLVFGVEQRGQRFEVLGVEDPDALQNDFLTTCRSTEKFSRPVDVKPKRYAVNDAEVLAFYVAPASRFDKPIRVRVKKSWQTFIRLASGDHQCSSEEEARFLRDASTETFDARQIPEISMEDLDPASLRWVHGLFKDRHPTRPLSAFDDIDFLDELGLLRDRKLTNAAALLLGRERLVAQLKPAGVVDLRVIRQPWSEEAPAHRFDDRELWEGNIVQGLRAMIERFLRLVPNPFALDPATLQRQPHPPEYPALREALVNLLIHQDYSDQHRTARILWYDDRTIFDNPGDSFVAVPEMLEGGVSDLRNPRIARLLRQIGFAEQAGTGLATIVRTWREVERTPPRIENDPGKKSYCLTLRWARVPKLEDHMWKQRLGVSISADEARVLDWLRVEGVGDRRTARLATGRSLRDTQELLEHLAVNQLVEPVDEETESYRVAPHILEILAQLGGLSPASAASTDHETVQVTEQVTEQVGRLLQELAGGPASAAELMRQLGLSHRPSFMASYLHPALDAGLAEMTIPDRPRSSRQQYRLTPAGRASVGGGGEGA